MEITEQKEKDLIVKEARMKWEKEHKVEVNNALEEERKDTTRIKKQIEDEKNNKHIKKEDKEKTLKELEEKLKKVREKRAEV